MLSTDELLASARCSLWSVPGGATAEERSHRASAALRLAQCVNARDPSNVAAWTVTGAALRKLGRPAEAAAVYEEVLHLRPRHPRAATHLHHCHLALGHQQHQQQQHHHRHYHHHRHHHHHHQQQQSGDRSGSEDEAEGGSEDYGGIQILIGGSASAEEASTIRQFIVSSAQEEYDEEWLAARSEDDEEAEDYSVNEKHEWERLNDAEAAVAAAAYSAAWAELGDHGLLATAPQPVARNGSGSGSGSGSGKPWVTIGRENTTY